MGKPLSKKISDAIDNNDSDAFIDLFADLDKSILAANEAKWMDQAIHLSRAPLVRYMLSKVSDDCKVESLYSIIKENLTDNILTRASANLKVQLLKVVIKHGEDKILIAIYKSCKQASNNFLPLHFSAEQPGAPCHKTLIENLQIKLDLRDRRGLSALCVAIKHRERDMAKCLIKNGAEINATVLEDRNQAPLHYAIMTKQVDVVELLVTNGASLQTATTDGQTPEDYLRRYPCTQIENFLKKHKNTDTILLNIKNEIKVEHEQTRAKIETKATETRAELGAKVEEIRVELEDKIEQTKAELVVKMDNVITEVTKVCNKDALQYPGK